MFDLSEERPDKVLSRLYANIERLKRNGDPLAFHIEECIRIIVMQTFMDIFHFFIM